MNILIKSLLLICSTGPLTEVGGIDTQSVYNIFDKEGKFQLMFNGKTNQCLSGSTLLTLVNPKQGSTVGEPAERAIDGNELTNFSAGKVAPGEYWQADSKDGARYIT